MSAIDKRVSLERLRAAAAAGGPRSIETLAKRDRMMAELAESNAPKVTPAVHRAADVIFRADTTDAVCDGWVPQAREALAAALDGPKDQYDVMDDITIAVHAAICEGSPEECVEWRGVCVKAVEAARAALLGADQ